MKRKFMIHGQNDRIILASLAELMRYADPEDLACRDSLQVENRYHKDWFYTHEGDHYFDLPAIVLEDGVVLFINGRHRTLVLDRHLDEIPMLLVDIDNEHFDGARTENSTSVLRSLRVRYLEDHQTFEMPDLEYGDFKQAL